MSVKNANPHSPRLWVSVFAVLALVILGGCGAEERAAKQEPAPVSTWFPARVGSVTLSIQLAVTEPEMARGLMGRRDLAQNQGMLFVYRAPTRMSFYMRNTPTPLDIGFFDTEGTLREVYPMYPFDETSVTSRASDLQYALEVNQGWYAANGLRPGAKLDLEAVRKAMRERGFE